MLRRRPFLLFTCEHGGNRVPREYAALFSGVRAQLDSHRGYDPGALPLARALARRFAAPLLACTTTRLFVDANRSRHNPAVLAARLRTLSPAQRREILDRYHTPHWEQVRRQLRALRRGDRAVLHLAVHSFTPVLHRRRRKFEVGLLYDPARACERDLACRWQSALREVAPELRVRRNAPYRGNADGLTTALRREFSPAAYLGLELELNQRCLVGRADRAGIAARVAASLEAVLGSD